jgi:hypothetical protein
VENSIAQFLGDLAIMFELALIAHSLVVLHQGVRQSATLLRLAGGILILGGAVGAVCSVYYYLQYRGQGAFEEAYPRDHMDARRMREIMGEMMGAVRGGMAPAVPAPEAAPSAGEHESHHPEARKTE